MTGTGWTTADERRARTYEPGDRVRIRSYYPPRIPKWLVGMSGVVVRTTSKGGVVVRVDERDYSCPAECIELKEVFV